MTTRAIIIHSLLHAEAALAVAAEMGVPVSLRSAPGAAASLGAMVFRAIISEATQRYPHARVTAVLDCGDAPGFALNAIRHGLQAIRVDAPDEVKERIADIASQAGILIDESNDPVLDLLNEDDPRAACRAWLAPNEVDS